MNKILFLLLLFVSFGFWVLSEQKNHIKTEKSDNSSVIKTPYTRLKDIHIDSSTAQNSDNKSNNNIVDSSLTNKNPCNNNPCVNGICNPTQDGLNYTCTCPDGYIKNIQHTKNEYCMNKMECKTDKDCNQGLLCNYYTYTKFNI